MGAVLSVRELRKWSRGDKHTFILKTPIVWMEPQNYIDGCFTVQIQMALIVK